MTPDQLDSELTNEAIEFVRGGFRRRTSLESVPDRASDLVGAERSSRLLVPVQDEHFKLKGDLNAALTRHSHIERLSSMFSPESEDIIIAYQDVVTCLKRIQKEWFTFLRSLVRIDVTRIGYLGHESELLVTRAVDRCIEDIFSKPEMTASRIFSPFTAKVASGSSSEIRQTAISSAEQMVNDFIDKAILNLDCLLNNCVCGIVSRHPKQVCEYFYGFRKLVLDTKRPEGFRTTSWISETQRQTFTSGIFSVVTDASAQFTVCFERHHLIHVIETAPDSGMVHIPRFQKQVIDSIPDWLRPLVRLIEGTLIGRQLIEHDEVPKNFSHEEQGEFLELDYRFDPAVILGQFVLTGWGPSEIDEDLAFNDSLREDMSPKSTFGKIIDHLSRTARGTTES